jgi:glycosyltransferase involved in cell wall biosynthesis
MCLLYALRAARHVPHGDVVVTNDFWLPVVLPWLQRKAGKVAASIARFPKGQFFLYKKCAVVVPVSESVALGIREQTPSIAEKVVVVPNCVDAAFLAALPPKQRRVAVRILFVGRIHPEKGLGLLASALQLLADADQRSKGPRAESSRQHEAHPRTNEVNEGRQDNRTTADLGRKTNWECVLVGPVAESEGGGGEAFAGELQRQLEGLPVSFQAPVYDLSALSAIYDTGDILIYPSVADTGEAMPLAPLEGMARGLVPVVSDLAAFREYLEPGKNGAVFDHRGPDAAANLARVLRELVGNAAQRAELGKAARSTAERFSPTAIADKYLQLFEKVVSGT